MTERRPPQGRPLAGEVLMMLDPLIPICDEDSELEGSMSSAKLGRIEWDELPVGPRRELLAKQRATGRVISIVFPEAWSDDELAEMLDGEYEPVLEV